MHIYIDEAGRGPLAGPVWVGLVMPLHPLNNNNIFADSKQLTHKQREYCYDQLHILQQQGKILYASGSASNKEIDRNGIIWSLRWSIIRALYRLIKKHQPDLLSTGRGCYHHKLLTLQIPLHLTIDGNHTFGLDQWRPVETIVKGDQKVPTISMASIIAKVERDRWMINQSKYYPSYSFDKHKGYGTKHHREMITTHGLSPIHRKSYCHLS